MKKGNETGRSMVEMLGVLAVIGVLSVAGIAGYNVAMTQHKANDALNQSVRLAMMLSSLRLISPNATLSSTDLEGTNFTVGEATDKIVLTLSNVPEKVATRLQNTPLKNANVSVNGNDVTFTFNNDLSEVSGDSNDTSADNEGIWEPTSCESDANCPSGETCIEKWGECYRVGQCNGSGMLVEGEGPNGEDICYPCNSLWNIWGTTATDCATCDNRSFDEDEQSCVLTSCPSGYKMTSYECEFDCSAYPGTRSYNGGEPVPSQPNCRCPMYAVWDSASSSCVCLEGYIKDRQGQCYSCDNDVYSEIWVTSAEECARCDNRFLTSSDDGLACAYCNAAGVYSGTTSSEECGKCNNRFLGLNQKCYPCSWPNYSVVEAEWAECTKCTNRKMDGYFCKLK